jgi:hypothetical protein
MNFFKVFRIAGAVSEWLEKSIGDGVIDENEIIDLVRTMLDIANVNAKIKVDLSE